MGQPKVLTAEPCNAIPAAVLSAVKGHVPMLLRHPCGASVIDELYSVVSALQRNHLAAEFYGKEYTLLSQVRPLLVKCPRDACQRQSASKKISL